LRTTTSYIGPSNLKLMPPSSRRTLMPCKTGKVAGRCHLILTSVRYYASPTIVIRSWQIIISTANNFKSSTTPYHLQKSLVEQSRKQHNEEGKFHPSLPSTQHPDPAVLKTGCQALVCKFLPNLYTKFPKLSNTPLIRQCVLICTHS
jgi:hypothetical protein